MKNLERELAEINAKIKAKARLYELAKKDKNLDRAKKLYTDLDYLGERRLNLCHPELNP